MNRKRLGTRFIEGPVMTGEAAANPLPEQNHGMPDGVPDPYQRQDQIFPHLSEEMTRRVAAYGVEEMVPSGTTIFERGQRSVDFFLVLQGSIEIYDVDVHGNAEIFTVHGANQFAGELDLFNDRAILVSGRAGGDTGWCASSAPTSGGSSAASRTSAKS